MALMLSSEALLLVQGALTQYIREIGQTFYCFSLGHLVWSSLVVDTNPQKPISTLSYPGAFGI